MSAFSRDSLPLFSFFLFSFFPSFSSQILFSEIPPYSSEFKRLLALAKRRM